MLYTLFPSCILSSTPVIVTVRGAFQFSVVKVMLSGYTVPSSESLLLIPIETSERGFEFRTTEKVSSPPDSVVVNPVTGSTVHPQSIKTAPSTLGPGTITFMRWTGTTET